MTSPVPMMSPTPAPLRTSKSAFLLQPLSRATQCISADSICDMYGVRAHLCYHVSQLHPSPHNPNLSCWNHLPPKCSSSNLEGTPDFLFSSPTFPKLKSKFSGMALKGLHSLASCFPVEPVDSWGTRVFSSVQNCPSSS